MNGRSSTFGGLLAIVLLLIAAVIGLVHAACYLDGHCPPDQERLQR